ncbi:uncharacterized protein [Pyxicephalus adspersus]|uniref:uncharacterized protein n=1 Tax=Pyxicephalus adspersus TaxID=30357 RepID=UPI003B5921C7
MDELHSCLVQLNLLLLQLLVSRRLTGPRVIRHRRWVHQLTAQRHSKGAFMALYQRLRRRPNEFHNYARMTVASFDELLRLLSPFLRRQRTNMRMPVSPAERLLLTLRFLATGESFDSLHYQYRLGKSTIHGIVHDTCRRIWEVLQPTYMPQLSEQVWKEAAQGFFKKPKFPNCVGAVGGKQVKIRLPPGSRLQNYNYRKFISTILMAVVDADYRFIAVDVGSFDSTADSNAFWSTSIGRRLYAQCLDLPGPSPIEEGGEPMPHVLVGDEVFGLNTNLMSPFVEKNLNSTKKVFNYRLERARRYVECTFGLLANKWRVFHTTLVMTPENADSLIKAACVLHNFVRQKEGINFDDIADDPFTDVACPLVRECNEADTVREKFANYFVSPAGELPWQHHHM